MMKIRILFTSIILSLLFINAKAAENSILDVKDNDFYIGEENAPITIIEYASMSCSHCADFHNDTLAELKKEFIDTGKVKFIFRDFPFNYPALAGSMILRCVPDEVRYDYMNGLISFKIVGLIEIIPKQDLNYIKLCKVAVCNKKILMHV